MKAPEPADSAASLAETAPPPAPGGLTRADRTVLGITAVLFAASLACVVAHAPALVRFVVTAVTLAGLASVVGRATDHLGARTSPGVTGVVQSALGNLPELFFAIFALRAGLTAVVSAALVGSILANVLAVLGVAFVVGGLRHGPQHFDEVGPRQLATLFALATAALAVPSLSAHLHIPVSEHEGALSLITSVVLLVLFAFSLPASTQGATGEVEVHADGLWPMPLVVGVLLAASVGSAFVADWFVAALTPAIHVLHMSEAFAGFVVVAIASNAVENVVGVRLAAKDRPAYAVSVIVQSPLQIIYVLFPVLVLWSAATGHGAFTLVLSPILLIVLVLAALIVALVVDDGESTWFEGVCLLGLYVVIATAFWWG
jgi:Ca2+:H+ antiporter